MLRLKQVMREKNVSGVQLRELVKANGGSLSLTSIYKLMDSKEANPRLKTLQEIAKALDVRISDLIDEQDGEPIYITRGEQYLKIGEINTDIIEP